MYPSALRRRRKTPITLTAALTPHLTGLGTAYPSTAHAQATEDGCVANSTCGCTTPEDLSNGKPTWFLNAPAQALTLARVVTNDAILAASTDGKGYTAFVNTTSPAAGGGRAAVANSTEISVYRSEGSPILDITGLLCICIPDQKDEQAPGAIESPADATTPSTPSPSAPPPPPSAPRSSSTSPTAARPSRQAAHPPGQHGTARPVRRRPPAHRGTPFTR